MAPKKHVEQNELMIVNDSPGEECRIAIIQNNHLEELYTERVTSATNVGNIYKGRVVNVEPAIQAAFIDYGEGINGFLHISDLHPKYFPGEERTERVGKKIPRRERPPIQEALRRGQEILVQVLKEGIGTKGPTLTSYLSIPGRLLVLMPDMDRVGVSRKVEDEEKRREMRTILDSLNLPDGFGFILRTAGFGETKTELKRDAAYLMRLWKVMEKRIKSVGAPCELYTESDLLIRTVRDILRPTIKAIVVDSPSAFERVSGFLRVVAPRSAPQVLRYRKSAPVFHAFDIERQIDLIHSREVPLASGGRLVIDQTEALVAIDVNSGKSRSARDSETNAYETNIEAADEICRQLRLRDLGGLIVNDLIDMHATRHRKAIEERFTNNLKRDRAKATALPISDFGILEMTRQRMRPSIRKSHFAPCSHCNGRGEIKVPEHVSADAVRHTGFLLQYDRVKRVEMVCSPRVATVLLSAKRRELVRVEDETKKRVDVRVSDAIAVDRVDFYAYDDRNADIDILHLPALQPPSLDELEAAQLLPEPEVVVEADDSDVDEETSDDGQRRRRRGRGRGRPGPADATAIALAGDFEDELAQLESGEEEESDAADGRVTHATGQRGDGSQADKMSGHEHGGRRRRRRRRRGGAGGGAPHGQPHPHAQPHAPTHMHDGAPTEGLAGQDAIPLDADTGASIPAQPNGQQKQDEGGRRRRRRRRRRRFGEQMATDNHASPTSDTSVPVDGQPPATSESPAHDEQGHNVRVHELARELHVTSHEVIQACGPDAVLHHVTTPLSTVTPDEATTIREMFADESGAGETDQAGSAQVHESAGTAPQVGPQRKRRRRGRRGRGGGGGPQHPQASSPMATTIDASAVVSPEVRMTATVQGDGQGGGGRRSRRRRRGRRGRGDSSAGFQSSTSTANTSSMSGMNPQPSSESRPASTATHGGSTQSPSSSSQDGSAAQAKKKRRALYRAGRRPVPASARQNAGDESE